MVTSISLARSQASSTSACVTWSSWSEASSSGIGFGGNAGDVVVSSCPSEAAVLVVDVEASSTLVPFGKHVDAEGGSRVGPPSQL